MTLKQKALAHYDRMIEWAKKQPKKNKCDRVNMYYHISETWSGSHCPYCQKMSEKDLNCSYCRLHADNDDDNCCCEGAWMDMANAETYCCCDGAWMDMANAETWGTWVKRARKVREYIEKHG